MLFVCFVQNVSFSEQTFLSELAKLDLSSVVCRESKNFIFNKKPILGMESCKVMSQFAARLDRKKGLVNVFIMMVWVGCLIVHLWIKNVCEI
jgi:hypothetical protein